MKKLVIFIIIILFFISVYKDLSIGTSISSKGNTQNKPDQTQVEQIPYDVIKIKLAPGDTVLSVVERLNPNLNNISVTQILADFNSINPTADPNVLVANNFYFFPKYLKRLD